MKIKSVNAVASVLGLAGLGRARGDAGERGVSGRLTDHHLGGLLIDPNRLEILNGLHQL